MVFICIDNYSQLFMMLQYFVWQDFVYFPNVCGGCQ